LKYAIQFQRWTGGGSTQVNSLKRNIIYNWMLSCFANPYGGCYNGFFLIWTVKAYADGAYSYCSLSHLGSLLKDDHISQFSYTFDGGIKLW